MSSIKKIKVTDLQLGMYLIGMEGSWMNSPFWRSRFLLDSEKDLSAARSCGLHECWIDIGLGIDVAPRAPAAPAAKRSVPATPPSARAPRQLHQPQTLAQELVTAVDLCEVAGQTILAVFEQTRLGNSIDVPRCVAVVDDIVASVARNSSALISLSRIKSEDGYTYMHSVAVCALMVGLAQSMKMPVNDVREAGLAGLLHDIGKAKIPLHILNKPGALEDSEFETVKRHPEHGYDTLADSETSAQVRDACLHHHERMDGQGYPDRQSGADISPMARMAAVCDVYDAITSDRPYKKGWDPADAIAKMISWRGHFDPAILSTFVGLVGIYPAGSVVKLKSGRLAVVVEQNPRDYTRPTIEAFFCTLSDKPLKKLRVDLAVDFSDGITGSEISERWPRELINQLWRDSASS